MQVLVLVVHRTFKLKMESNRTEERSQGPLDFRLGPLFLQQLDPKRGLRGHSAIYIFTDLCRHHASFSRKDTPLEQDACQWTRSKGRTRKFDSDQQTGDDF